MKFAKFILIGCLLSVGTFGFAQEGTSDLKEEAKTHQNRDAMLAQLNLTEDQKAQIEVLKENTKAKAEVIKNDTSLDDEARRAQLKELKEAQWKHVSALLTDEQRTQFEALRAEQKQSNSKTPGEIANTQTERMKDFLDLTDDQVEKVRALNLKVALKIDAIKNDESMDAARKKEFIEGNRQDHKTMMKSILTEEQFTKYEEHLAAKKSFRKGGHSEKETPAAE